MFKSKVSIGKVLCRIDENTGELSTKRPLTRGEVEWLRDEFLVEYTYNSNVIEGIHPFVDGNGRTGRLLMNLALMQNGYPVIDVKFTDRRRYYDAFDAYYRTKMHML